MSAKNLSIQAPIDNVDIATLRSAVESSRSPLIITDNNLPDNPIIYSNKAFEDMTGYAMSEIIGNNCRFLQGKDTDIQEVGRLRSAVKNGEYIHTTLKNYRKDGTEFWNDLVLSPIKDAHGTTTHFLGMQLDITGRVHTEEHLQASNEELEQFTYATSHDLQEPLRMISSYLQLIRKRYGDGFDEDAKTFLAFATEGADRMQALIDDLLTLSRVSSTSDQFKLIATDKIIERALFNLKMSIDEQDAQIDIGTMPTLAVDAVQMTQLFQNLISNAIKYRRPDARPEIVIRARKRAETYVFSVADNGIGIPEKHFVRIFQVFQRLHTRSEYQGTGVGLTICSKIVDRHGGKIWVESDTAKGSTFSFSIPSKERS